MADESNGEAQIPLPKDGPAIYSKRAIWGFSFAFTTIFGGILLMQNLKDAGKKKEALWVLTFSVLFTVASIYVVNIPEKPLSGLTNIVNGIGGAILSEAAFRKYFPNADEYPKKRIWKPLIVSILIMIPFVLAAVFEKR